MATQVCAGIDSEPAPLMFDALVRVSEPAAVHRLKPYPVPKPVVPTTGKVSVIAPPFVRLTVLFLSVALIV